MTTMLADAVLSEDERYRYTLTRVWDDALPKLALCGLNPSTADWTTNDPTIRKEIGFAMRFGFGGIVKLNASALRSSDPSVLTAADFWDMTNQNHILDATRGLPVIACWGASFPKAAAHHMASLREMLFGCRDVFHLGLTKDRHPRHPLYLPYEGTVMTRWSAAADLPVPEETQ